MPLYVYALHDFIPEHEDEVEFRAGERIEVVEKDDLYQDGWWQGRNLAGKVGLFPQSYTTPAPPISEQVQPAAPAISGDAHALQTLDEESEGESPTAGPSIKSPVPKQTQSAAFLDSEDSDGDAQHRDDESAAGDGEMMKATLTDVQKAIEQLGRNRVDGDGARSFSFASTHDGGTESETDFDLSDVDHLDDAEAQGDWHKGARRKLAERARKAIEDAERMEAMLANGGERRSTAPPIDVELSDDSDDEGDPHEDFTSTSFSREHAKIPEEDEEEEEVPVASGSGLKPPALIQPELSTSTIIPKQQETEPTPTSIQESPVAEEEPATPPASRSVFQAPTTPSAPVFAPQIEKVETAPGYTSEETRISIDPKRSSAPPLSNAQPVNGYSSPTVSSQASGVPHEGTSTTSSVSRSASTNATSAPTTRTTFSEDKKEKKHPSDWGIEEVVAWLKSKGFDQDVCDKFTEQEITGDVLLELDVNILKTEIGILAFGKRMRIANAITELRRPPSIDSYEPRHSDMQSPSSAVHQPQGHSRTQSLAPSHHSYPGNLYINSLGSPLAPNSSPNGPASAQEPITGSVPTAIVASASAAAIIGLGITEGEAKSAKSRPSQLKISPSSAALKDKIVIATPEDDRAHMSDGEITTSQSMRRRLFGRSQDSSVSIGASSRQSKDGLSPATSSLKIPAEKEKDALSSPTSRHRSKRSVDKGSERLSIFGNTFGASLSKGRKPPPSEDVVSDSKSGSMFSRLQTGSIRKPSSNRTTSPAPSPKAVTSSIQAERTEKARTVSAPVAPIPVPTASDLSRSERGTLRKRTTSGPNASQGNGIGETGEAPLIKPGQSILEQIGEPDHTGYMKKKAARYNTWKLRYFVLKGEHLYILRQNSKSETRLKGYINVRGYRVTVDETLDPGRYCFRIDHDHDKTHFFSSDQKLDLREWMKAIMKATIGRDYTKPVVSSCNIPTIPLVVAQAMNPAPRPPSPGARAATQKALRRENPNQLSSRDARVLMGLPSTLDVKDDRKNVQNFFAEGEDFEETVTTPKVAAPPRPSREMRRMNSTRSAVASVIDESLVDWANDHLPTALQAPDGHFTGLHLLRIAESIRGKPASPPVPDSAFPMDPTDDKLDGLFRLFDYLLDNDVKMGSVSINDVRQGKPDKIAQLIKALKAWEDKRLALAQSLTGTSAVATGQFVVY